MQTILYDLERRSRLQYELQPLAQRADKGPEPEIQALPELERADEVPQAQGVQQIPEAESTENPATPEFIDNPEIPGTNEASEIPEFGSEPAPYYLIWDFDNVSFGCPPKILHHSMALFLAELYGDAVKCTDEEAVTYGFNVVCKMLCFLQNEADMEKWFRVRVELLQELKQYQEDPGNPVARPEDDQLCLNVLDERLEAMCGAYIRAPHVTLPAEKIEPFGKLSCDLTAQENVDAQALVLESLQKVRAMRVEFKKDREGVANEQAERASQPHQDGVEAVQQLENFGKLDQPDQPEEQIEKSEELEELEQLKKNRISRKVRRGGEAEEPVKRDALAEQEEIDENERLAWRERFERREEAQEHDRLERMEKVRQFAMERLKEEARKKEEDEMECYNLIACGLLLCFFLSCVGAFLTAFS
ncbi:unnamed protein product, partial [Mesorhabditis spiculigera]